MWWCYECIFFVNHKDQGKQSYLENPKIKISKYLKPESGDDSRVKGLKSLIPGWVWMGPGVWTYAFSSIKVLWLSKKKSYIEWWMCLA